MFPITLSFKGFLSNQWKIQPYDRMQGTIYPNPNPKLVKTFTYAKRSRALGLEVVLLTKKKEF